MADVIGSVRGMRVMAPDEAQRWRDMENICLAVLHTYGYSEIRLPLVERAEVFTRSIGENTDIVSKEMYLFADRHGEMLALRPEGTASCVRAGIETGLFTQRQRLWYMGPMFRYERPQKGRYRQFHQIGAEVYGLSGPAIEAEMLCMGQRLWRRLGVPGITLEINCLGDTNSRARYLSVLSEYFTRHQSDMTEEQRMRLQKNPLRLLDAKDENIKDMAADAPVLTDFLDETSARHFSLLQDMLTDVGISFRINLRLVRGLDYYNGLVFEWICDRLGAQNAICAGGRYDNLVKQFGGPSTPGMGFAIGLERLAEVCDLQARQPATSRIHVVSAGEVTERFLLELTERLRDQSPGWQWWTDGAGSLKSQLRRADKAGACYALIVGDEEKRSGRYGLKALRQSGVDQQPMDEEGLARLLCDETHAPGLSSTR